MGVQWIFLGVWLVLPIAHYAYHYGRYRFIAKFLWRVYKASSFNDTHLVAAAKALYLVENGGSGRIVKHSTTGPL